MRLLINAIPLLGQQTGIGNYTRHIANAALKNRELFDVSFFYGYYSKKLAANSEISSTSWLGAIRNLAIRQPAIRSFCKKGLVLANAVCQFAKNSAYDCYFEPNFVLIPGARANRIVLTVHDFSCFLYPDWHPVERVRHMEKYFWKSLEKACRIITVSNAIRQEAIKLFGIDQNRIQIIPNGVNHAKYKPAAHEDIARLRRARELPEHFILYVGTLEPRKNLQNLLLAHAMLPEKLQDKFPLILIGSDGWKNDDILDLINKNSRHIHMLGYVPELELPIFYSASSLFVYPSWYEGFGLPALEAMACGCPVLTSDNAALVELCADAALHAGGSADALADSMRELLEDDALRANLRQKALQRAAYFSWEKSAARHLQLFMDIVS